MAKSIAFFLVVIVATVSTGGRCVAIEPRLELKSHLDCSVHLNGNTGIFPQAKLFSVTLHSSSYELIFTKTENESLLNSNESEVILPVFKINPNPIVSNATIMLDLPKSGRSSITIYDVLGRRVAVIADRELPMGQQSYDLDLQQKRLSTGIYFVQLRTVTGIWTKRICIIR